jgi:hypothetical protein
MLRDMSWDRPVSKCFLGSIWARRIGETGRGQAGHKEGEGVVLEILIVGRKWHIHE